MIKIRVFFLAVLMTAMSILANAQSEGAVFSLYSQYGLGELSSLGTAASRGMGGVGIATRERYAINLLNPAAYTMVDRKNALFSIGAEGVNNYYKTSKGSNSRNFLNLGHLAMQFRVAKRFGFGVSLAPYSDMGYELSVTDKGEDVMTNIGNIQYNYVGSGGIAQFKGGFAYNPFGRFNIGINYIYYIGGFKQDMSTSINSYLFQESYRNIYTTLKSRVNQSSFEIGAQYTLMLKNLRAINFGATFQPKMESALNRSFFKGVGYSAGAVFPNDMVDDRKYDEKYYFPMKVSMGVAYYTPKLHAEINYNYQDWSDASFPQNNVAGITYSSRQEIRAGVQYTPNRFDIRSHFKRWSYRAGLMYGNSYVVKNGYQSKDISGSIGLGIPMEHDWFSTLNISTEIGRSGALKDGQVKSTFVKLNVGFNFAARGWFLRYKHK